MVAGVGKKWRDARKKHGVLKMKEKEKNNSEQIHS
jgi:hypothetical protein